MEQAFYSSAAWRQAREQVLQRDKRRCTVGRLLGGGCRGALHVHHIDPAADPLDERNLASVCAAHHSRWEAVRRAVIENRSPRWRRCRHIHRYRGGREACERRLNAA